MRILPALLLCFSCRNEEKPAVETGAVDTAIPSVDADGDGYDESEDCDDNNSVVNPGAEEICDGVDNNCDGTVDEGVTSTFYADTDGDAYGDPDNTTEACEIPDGHTVTGSDCDDGNEEVYPNASEQCDDLDNDCDGEVDEDVRYDWYADADGDGFGDPDSAFDTCDPPPGYVTDDTDCDDTEDAAYPGAEEVCDEVDNDCDDEVDENVTTTYYQDTDGDGFGIAETTTEACDVPTGYAADAGDCDDADGTISPNATEVCDGTDNDCNGDIDSDAVDQETFYADSDGDGFGNASSTTTSCDTPSGYTTDDADCDDGDSAINPDAAEVCDGVDNDCNGWTDDADPAITGTTTWYRDLDSDGYGDALTDTDACDQPTGYVADATDCDDGDAASYPGATETCDEADNDCDGTTDEGVTTTFYADADGDGHGDPDSTTEDCSQPSGYVANTTDCDDTDAATSPNAFEVCDGADNDCDGDTDESDAVDATDFYADTDGDGFGDASSTTTACDAPSGYTADDADCDDGDSAINPDAAEACDEIDNNCNGETDEGTGVGDTFYADDDGDGFGNASSTIQACSEPSGYTADSDDCDDTDAAINPDADEACDGIDNNCSGTADDDADLLGSAEACPAVDCLEIYEERSSATDDVYWIDPASSGTAFEVFCDLTNDGGGWTLVANVDDVSDPWFGGQQTTPWESTTLRNETSIPTFDADVSVSTKYESWNTVTASDVRIVYKNSGSVFLCEDLSYKDTLDAIFSDTPTQGDCSSVCSTWSEDLLSETSIDDAGLNCSDPNEGWITATSAENARVGALSYSHSCCVYNGFLGAMGDRGYSTSTYEKTWGAYSAGTVTDDNIMVFVR